MKIQSHPPIAISRWFRCGLATVTFCLLGWCAGAQVRAQSIVSAPTISRNDPSQQAAASRDAGQRIWFAWQQVEQIMQDIAAGVETQYPDYQTNMVQFKTHLQTCTPMQFHDPLHGITQTIQGWHNWTCPVQVITHDAQPGETCLYSATDLMQTHPPLIPTHCQAEGLPAYPRQTTSRP